MLILRQIFAAVENVNKCKKYILNMLSFEKKTGKNQVQTRQTAKSFAAIKYITTVPQY